MSFLTLSKPKAERVSGCLTYVSGATSPSIVTMRFFQYLCSLDRTLRKYTYVYVLHDNLDFGFDNSRRRCRPIWKVKKKARKTLQNKEIYYKVGLLKRQTWVGADYGCAAS
jgi:hypothetical protein